MTKHCRDCRNPVGPARTWCFECRKIRLDTLLEMRFNAMNRDVSAHYLPAIDRMIEAVRKNDGDLVIEMTLEVASV